MTNREMSIDTQLIHSGEIRPGIEGAVALPIFQSANFESVEGEGNFIFDLISFSRGRTTESPP